MPAVDSRLTQRCKDQSRWHRRRHRPERTTTQSRAGRGRARESRRPPRRPPDGANQTSSPASRGPGAPREHRWHQPPHSESSRLGSGRVRRRVSRSPHTHTHTRKKKLPGQPASADRSYHCRRRRPGGSTFQPRQRDAGRMGRPMPAHPPAIRLQQTTPWLESGKSNHSQKKRKKKKKKKKEKVVVMRTNNCIRRWPCTKNRTYDGCGNRGDGNSWTGGDGAQKN